MLRFPIRLKVGIGTRLLEMYSVQNSIHSRVLDQYFKHFKAFCSTNRFDLWEEGFVELPPIESNISKPKQREVLEKGFVSLGTIATEYLFQGFPKEEILTGRIFSNFLDEFGGANMEDGIYWGFVSQVDSTPGWGDPFCYSELS